MASSRAIADVSGTATLATAVTGAGLAVIIAIIAVPLTALGIVGLAADDPVGAPEWLATAAPPPFAVALQLALGTSIVAAVAGGFAGGLVASVWRSRSAAVFTALVISWPLAIVAMPLLPALLGQPTAFVVATRSALSPVWAGWADVASPGAAGGGEAVWQGVQTYWVSLYWSVLAIREWPIWAPPVMAIAILHRRIRGARVVPGLMAGIALWAVINVTSVWRAAIPALVLVAGTLAWAFVLGRLTGVFDREDAPTD
jgi:hypothetical protein